MGKLVTPEDIQIPTYQDLLRPTLQALDELGGEANSGSIDEKTVAVAAVTAEQMAVEFGPEQAQEGSKVLHRTAWARTYLKKANLIENPKRGWWSLLDTGRQILDLPATEAERRLKELDNEIRRSAAGSGDHRIRRARDSAFEPTYRAARRWRDESLRTGASFFSPERVVWTSDVVADLRHRVIENFDESARSFGDKLADQLAGASQEVHLLAAEILYVHLLALSNVTVETKLENINGVGALAPEPFAVPDHLIEPLSRGLVNGGVGFNTNRYYLVEFLIEFTSHWSELSNGNRAQLLDDPWAFKAMLVALPQQRANAQRNAVLFLLFPAVFEDISSNDHKKRIAAAFADYTGDSTDLDRQLLEARASLRERFGPDFSWYSNEVRSVWDPAKAPTIKRSGPTSLSESIAEIFPDSADLQRLPEVFAAAIRAAHDVNARSWSLSRRRKGLALNVGPNRALFASSSTQLGLIAAGPKDEIVSALAEVGAEAKLDAFAFPNGAHYVSIDSAGDFVPAATALFGRIMSAIEESASRNTPYHKSFSEEAIVYLEEATATQLPRPATQPRHDGERAWIVRVKRSDGTGLAEALEDGETKVFWEINVPPGSSMEDIRAALKDREPDLSNVSLGNQAGNLHRFVSRMQPGDFVLMPDKSDLYFGTVIGDALYDPVAQEWTREVEWVNADAPVDRADVSPGLYSRLRTLLTVTEVSELAEEIRSFVDSDDAKPPVPEEVRLQPIDSDTAQTWMLDRKWLQDIVDMLSAKKQLIFHGPPGTGKTYLAAKLANQLTADNDGSYRIVQFHPSYSYEDFVEGFRPRVVDGNMTYELSPGPVRDLAEAARKNPADPYFLIIDEINRGNLAKIFGELYYLLEYRDESLILQYGNTADDEFSLPKNLFVIGTMNTADRSIAMVDAAIRRRFYFVEFSPSQEPISGLLRAWLKRERLDESVALLLEELNERLGDVDYAIGPSYLMTERVGDQLELERIWRHAIMPLLTEHFYGQPGAADRFELAALQRAVEAKQATQRTPVEASVTRDSEDAGDTPT